MPEYWIARAETRDVLLCSEPDAALGDYGRSEIVKSGSTLAARTLPATFPVDPVFAGMPGRAAE